MSKLHDQHDDVAELLRIYDEMRAMHHKFYHHISILGDKMKQRVYDIQDLTDIGFLSSKVATMMEEWRKDSKARREFADRLICLAVIEEGLSNPANAKDRTYGSLASGSPDMKMESQPPEPGAPGYEEFARHFGIGEEAIKTGLVKFSWKSLSQYLTECAEQGKPFPPGIPKPWPVHNVKYYAKKRDTDTNDKF